MFLVDKALAANEAFVSGQAAELRALAELGPTIGTPVAAAIKAKTALSIAAIAASTVSGFPGGGGGGNIGGAGGGAPAPVDHTPTFETKALDVSSAFSGGDIQAGSGVMLLRADAGDSIGEMLVEVVNDAIKNGKIVQQ